MNTWTTTTNLKNKIKLLELENKLLKNDVSNKQKFIHTILQHNSMLVLLDLLQLRQKSYDLWKYYEKKNAELNN